MPHPNPKKEAAWEHQPAQLKKHRERMRARRYEEKLGKVHKGDGKEVDHKAFLGGKGGGVNKKTASPSNYRVISQHANRIKQPKRK